MIVLKFIFCSFEKKISSSCSIIFNIVPFENKASVLWITAAQTVTSKLKGK